VGITSATSAAHGSTHARALRQSSIVSIVAHAQHDFCIVLVAPLVQRLGKRARDTSGNPAVRTFGAASAQAWSNIANFIGSGSRCRRFHETEELLAPERDHNKSKRSALFKCLFVPLHWQHLQTFTHSNASVASVLLHSGVVCAFSIDAACFGLPFVSFGDVNFKRNRAPVTISAGLTVALSHL
jgi:hypothetical protein